MQPDPISLEQAETLRDEILSLPGVAGMHGGQFGEVAMLYPGTRVRGLHLFTPRGRPDETRMEVHLIADLSQLPDLGELAEKVRTVTERYVTEPVDVFFSDAS
ncbi:hypothetical protein [Corynebacterium pygosceleis]|uniref:Uncharacterized protein n=1 Tax=Corynebacterium pygosceleis TaxID=2800406 RepID=A0A9Q4C8B0_9CORY|nr:hypothetical protein [Corynebacterium pygosceleis]MCK7637505.1 hypothetical protein [Corynebacterium pygosceleis]MCK7674692.1 hypothetical protein [Corynebacterium pygosceleis]MCL0119719.1 hypothetical protein [Corynebacterium pygosceleis]MCX7444966.1 hypothetical protein [Corynebacterium pygosceleis]MCX7468166.1 hypothetical protein [Corynebacterium pygosceleis]